MFDIFNRAFRTFSFISHFFTQPLEATADSVILNCPASEVGLYFRHAQLIVRILPTETNFVSELALGTTIFPGFVDGDIAEKLAIVILSYETSRCMLKKHNQLVNVDN